MVSVCLVVCLCGPFYSGASVRELNLFTILEKMAVVVLWPNCLQAKVFVNWDATVFQMLGFFFSFIIPQVRHACYLKIRNKKFLNPVTQKHFGTCFLYIYTHTHMYVCMCFVPKMGLSLVIIRFVYYFSDAFPFGFIVVHLWGCTIICK